MLALEREVGVELDHVADVDDDQERRPALVGRQALGVGLGLLARLAHDPVPLRPAAPAGAGSQFRKLEAESLELGDLLQALGALLGLQHEAAALVEVDEVGRGRTVQASGRDLALEDVGIFALGLDGRIGGRDVDQRAELAQEHLTIRPLAAARRAPARDEGLDLVPARRHRPLCPPSTQVPGGNARAANVRPTASLWFTSES